MLLHLQKIFHFDKIHNFSPHEAKSPKSPLPHNNRCWCITLLNVPGKILARLMLKAEATETWTVRIHTFHAWQLDN